MTGEVAGRRVPDRNEPVGPMQENRQVERGSAVSAGSRLFTGETHELYSSKTFEPVHIS